MRKVILSLLFVPALLISGACGQPLGLHPSDPAASRTMAPFTIPPVRTGVAYERFMVLGDMGTGHPDQKKVAAAMVRRAKTDGLDFILTVGDNFYPKGVKSANDPQWKTKFEDVYADVALQVPVYASLGNHDHYGNPQAEVDYAKTHPNWRMPAFYYTFTRTLGDGTQVQFFAIDSDAIEREKPGVDAQLAWLDQALSRSKARWRIVVGHHPVYGHNPLRGHNPRMIAKLEPILVKHGVDIYFAGHDHTMEMLKPVHGVNYCISGAGGGPDMAYPVRWTDEAFYAATLGGFVQCRISKDELVIEFVRLDARTQYAYTLTK